jgi:hypothetical protein
VGFEQEVSAMRESAILGNGGVTGAAGKSAIVSNAKGAVAQDEIAVEDKAARRILRVIMVAN